MCLCKWWSFTDRGSTAIVYPNAEDARLVSEKRIIPLR